LIANSAHQLASAWKVFAILAEFDLESGIWNLESSAPNPSVLAIRPQLWHRD
jgi:hypothetical protein